MTREEAKKELSKLIFELGFEDNVDDKVYALNVAIQALSQEPCTDAVSREAVLKEFEKGTENLYGRIDKLSSVNPQPCDDAISREWLIRKATERFYTTNYFNHISAMIEEAPSVMQKSGKWISVSEPPKELGTYLIQTDGEPYMCQCRWTDVNPFWTDLKTKPHWNIFDLPQYSKVVAWMPLPKPYEPQKSEVRNESRGY